ncbi:unnamed protein product [Rotaria socialis]|uniref:Autophagy-related protein 9 n=1 Tax=Rotaria socialis TaxID=392032 RepID=A0A821G581_9BILA|nr:unnamed protein product [Rotaria socialis]CAF3462862.1 unnamed protein product [Rotaria socialis]CAF3504713.1 unnamed protein product [Rotaria socialis]CAF3777399.1 unnamed protein product [Rotaria socialis]CAF4160508.1 unnamed protein product [Rotaria socialis]
MDYRTLVNEDNDGAEVPDQSLSPFMQFDTEEDLNNSEKQSQWSHQKDLDDFFVRVYQYHQQHGFFCIILSEIFGLVQFIFIVSFTVLIVQCIDYPLLFRSTPSARNITHKIHFDDIIQSPQQCLSHMHLLTTSCIILSIIYWLYRFSRALYNLISYYNIRAFYIQALDIKPNDLSNMTWHEVQQRLLLAQRTHHLCIHKLNLTELDIHNRLLRFKNYEVAMVNKGILPPRIHLPILGDIISFTTGFKFNLRLVLFWGPYAPFDERWHLRQEYKVHSQRQKLAKQLSTFILLYGLANLLLSPFIFIWQVLNLFYGYTELVRREPGVLGSRRWSNYGRLYLRHFNELDHSLNQRLNRGYKPAIAYMNSFVNYSIVETAKFISFASGAILAVLVLLTIYDEDVLNVEHMLTVMTSLGVVVGVCRSLIPDEHAVFDPEQMLQLVLAQVHYQPDSWKDHGHTDYVQAEFGQMFQLKYVYFLEELLSAFVTPLVLCFQFRRKSLQIIDFLRNFTVDVQGVGDVCSFAQLDITKHGDLKWFVPTRPKSPSNTDGGITNDGKLELSLMHFHHTNPNWQMSKQCEAYLEKIQERAVENMHGSSVLQQSMNDMQNLQTQQSFYSDPLSTTSLNNRSIFSKPLMNTSSYTPSHTTVPVPPNASIIQNSFLNGGVSKADLPYRSSAQYGVLSKIHTQMFDMSDPNSFMGSLASIQGLPGAAQLDMNVSCLFMHELRHKYKHGEYEDLENISEDQNNESQC